MAGLPPASFELLVLLGATASGKTALAVQLARCLNGEIISADSRQVYRGMDLGTGKDLAEYADIPYHLIDIAAPGTEYNLFQFQRDCFVAIDDIRCRGRLPLLCGGTGMYLDAVLRGYRLVEVAENPELRATLAGLSDGVLRQRLQQLKPQLHNRTDLEKRERLVRAIEIAEGERSAAVETGSPLRINSLVFGLRWPREVLRQRIAQRLDRRFAAGMIDEVAQLHAAGVAWEKLEFYGLEYRLIAQFLQGHFSRAELGQRLRSAIGQFAKRQDTFFRRMEKQGIRIHWLTGGLDSRIHVSQVLELMHQNR